MIIGDYTAQYINIYTYIYTYIYKYIYIYTYIHIYIYILVIIILQERGIPINQSVYKYQYNGMTEGF